MIATQDILTESLGIALETMSFLTTEPPDSNLGIPERSYWVELDFTGPVNGTIEIMGSTELAKLLVINTSGIEQVQVNEEKCIDALKELVNVVSGLLFPMLPGLPTDVFDIKVPVLKGEGGISQCYGEGC